MPPNGWRIRNPESGLGVAFKRPFGKFDWANSQLTASLGALEFFPVEIIAQILLQMDIPTLINFRAVNRKAWTILSRIPEYKFLLANHLPLLMASAAAKANSFSCLTLYKQIRPPRLELECQTPGCERRGEFYWLLSGTILCPHCLHPKNTKTITTHEIWPNPKELAELGINHIIVKTLQPCGVGPRFFQVFDDAEFCDKMSYNYRTQLPYEWGYKLASVWLKSYSVVDEKWRITWV